MSDFWDMTIVLPNGRFYCLLPLELSSQMKQQIGKNGLLGALFILVPFGYVKENFTRSFFATFVVDTPEYWGNVFVCYPEE